MKRVSIFVLLVSIVVLTIMPVFAEESNTAQPRYNNISTIVVGLRIDEDEGVAYCTGSVSAYYQVPVEVLVQLQVYKGGQWKTLMSWSAPGTGAIGSGGQFAVEPGYNYRTRVTGYICNDLGIPVESETETKEVYYPAS